MKCSLRKIGPRMLFLIFLSGTLYSQGKELKIEALPDPPTIGELSKKSDLIFTGELLFTHKYQVGNRLLAQSRFVCNKIFKNSQYFRLKTSEPFTVLYELRPDEIGMHFQTPPEKGNYVVFLELRNVELKGDIIGFIPTYVVPQPFAIWEETQKIILEIQNESGRN